MVVFYWCYVYDLKSRLTRVSDACRKVQCTCVQLCWGTSSDAYIVQEGVKRNSYPTSHIMHTYIKIRMHVWVWPKRDPASLLLFLLSFEQRTQAFWTQWDVLLFGTLKNCCRDSRLGPIFSLCFRQRRSPPCERPDLNDNFLCNGALNFIAAWIML